MGCDWLTGNPILTRHHERHSKKGFVGVEKPPGEVGGPLFPPELRRCRYRCPGIQYSLCRNLCLLCRNLFCAASCGRRLDPCWIVSVALGWALQGWHLRSRCGWPLVLLCRSQCTVWRSWRCASLVNCGDNGYWNTNLIVTVDTCWNPCLSVCLPNVPA